jgi:hypothetical protein
MHRNIYFVIDVALQDGPWWDHQKIIKNASKYDDKLLYMDGYYYLASTCVNNGRRLRDRRTIER